MILAFFATTPLAAQQAAPTPQPSASPPQPQYQQSAQWSTLPKMVFERQFAGPLPDTVIQRLSDPVDGTVCYIYLPISAPHSQTTNTGFVQYGSVNTGTITCMPAPPRVSGAPRTAASKTPAPKPAPVEQ